MFSYKIQIVFIHFLCYINKKPNILRNKMFGNVSATLNINLSIYNIK